MRTRLALLAATTISLACAARIDPAHAKNLTLYHVNPRNYSLAPVDMNTADLNGDMYFDLRTVGLPLECGPWRNRSFWSHLDCDNPEVDNVSTLAITKLTLEVDSRWGDYADCNLDPDTGAYNCACENVQANCTALTPSGLHDDGRACNMSSGCDWSVADRQCEPYGCANMTDRLDCVMGYHKCAWDAANMKCTLPPGPQPVCNKTLVGLLNLSTVDWGRHSHHGQTPSKIDYWHGNVLSKTNGFWFSTWAEGQCRDDPAQAHCSWRVVADAKKVAKTCSDHAIDGVIEAGDRSAPWGARCFDGCTAAQRANHSSECWIECFYANILGPNGSSMLLNHSSPNFGIPLPELQAAWDKPFVPEDQGGCPPLE
jgi:hypothetical protein